MLIPFQCQYCNGYFCEEHRLPENHECVGLDLKKPIFRYSKFQKFRRGETPKEAKQLPAIPAKEVHSNKRTLKKKVAIAVGIVLAILIVSAFSIIVLVPLMVNQLQPRYYTLGEEIKGLPTLGEEKVSITFTSCNVTNKFRYHSPDKGNSLVVFNFTIRNTADIEIYTLGIFFPFDEPLLKYDGYYAQIETFGYWEHNFSLMPNQTMSGWMYYEILEGYEPIELVYPNKESPEIIVKIT